MNPPTPPETALPAPLLTARGLVRRFGGEEVLRGVDLDVRAGETLSVLGRSGGGKTTLLRVLAGLTAPDAGTVWLGGQDVTAAPPERRGVVYLSQEPLLFPHLDVAGNLAFAPRLRGRPAAEVRAAVDGLLAALGLAPHARKQPHQLSGGQKQRVAFGRALAAAPRLLLLDEPFSSLDPAGRAELQELFRRVVHERRMTALFVTHDLREALTLGDRFGHLQAGRLTLHEGRAAFAADPATGVQAERAFWAALDTPPAGAA